LGDLPGPRRQDRRAEAVPFGGLLVNPAVVAILGGAFQPHSRAEPVDGHALRRYEIGEIDEARVEAETPAEAKV